MGIAPDADPAVPAVAAPLEALAAAAFSAAVEPDLSAIAW